MKPAVKSQTQSSQRSLRDRFVQGMALSAATVNVVTTAGHAGRSGVTVSAMTSVSADGEAPTLLPAAGWKSGDKSVGVLLSQRQRTGCRCRAVFAALQRAFWNAAWAQRVREVHR